MYGDVVIRPFHFANLPSISRDEIHFFDALAKAFPLQIFTGEFLNSLFQPLEKYIQTQVGWSWLGQDHMLSLEQVKGLCLAPTLLVQIALVPHDHRILLEIDPRLVKVMVDRALGGSGDISQQQSLTEVEHGVFSFFLLKLIDHIQQAWGDSAQAEFRLDQIHEDLTPLLQSLPPDTLYYRKEMRLNIIGQNGFVRIHIPTDLVQQSCMALTQQGESEQTIQFIRSRLHRVSDTPAVGSVYVGTVDLSEADLAGLEEDDIVLLRDCLARRQDEGVLAGEVMIRFSLRPHYGLRCTILDTPSSPNSSIQIEELVSIAEPVMKGTLDRSEYEMDENQEYANEYEPGGPEEDNLGQMAPMLSDVPVPLVVELGRVECRAHDVMHLRIGQVLDLQRSPYEPIDLVVNGQILGKGELVEVDGQLGVRIIELHR